MPHREKQSKPEQSDDERERSDGETQGQGLFRADELPPVPDSARQPPSVDQPTLFGSGVSPAKADR